jgi:prepilin-type N-terminal cleavage/methylation domain-containing protein
MDKISRTPSAATRRNMDGFSLIELLVAMAATLVVSGAIYGLLASGNNAFRRQPEVADRQQNIRVAMDFIFRDVVNAGGGMPFVSQIFTQSDTIPAPGQTGAGYPFLNGAGPMGVLGPAAAAARLDPTGTGDSENSDILELLIADESCPVYTGCGSNPTPLGIAAGEMWTREAAPSGSCFLPTGGGLVILTDNRLFDVRLATLLPKTDGCPSATGTRNGHIRLTAPLAEWTTGAETFNTSIDVPTLAYAGRVIRYMIAPDPTDAAPALWRSETGRYDSVGALVPAPAPGATNWQLIARGIEDMQVEYLNGNVAEAWANNPGVVAPCALGNPTPCILPELQNVIRRVRVTLSARSEAPLLAGETRPAGGAAPTALRGQLVSVMTPRIVPLGLEASSSVTLWR